MIIMTNMKMMMQMMVMVLMIKSMMMRVMDRPSHSSLCLPPAVVPFLDVFNKSLCQTREVLVNISEEYPEDIEYNYIPSCVVLTRCAGCCNDEALECVPTETRNVTMEVSSAYYHGQDGVKLRLLPGSETQWEQVEDK